MNPHLVEIKKITKRFDKVKAVDDLSCNIQRGEIFALLGPNGAGKTTTVRMLLNIIRPDSGSLHYCLDGKDVKNPASPEIGYLPEDRGLYKEIPIEKTLVYMGLLRGMQKEDAVKATAQWLERVGLKDRAKDKLDALSKGNQQKVQFISAILHKPAFAILDEPFSGLDPINQEFFIDVIRELQRQGTTILLSAHQMNLVERLADRVLLMNRGKEVLTGTIAQVKDKARSTHKVILTPVKSFDRSLFKKVPAVLDIEHLSDGTIAFHLKKGVNISKFLSAISAKVGIASIQSEQVTLHEVFVQSVKTDSLRPEKEMMS